MTKFIGFENLEKIDYQTIRGEETRCYFCSNLCIRTFIDLNVNGEKKRHIIATCDKGEIETKEELKQLLAKKKELKDKYPNFVEISNKLLFKSYNPKNVVNWNSFRNFFRKDKLEKLKNTVVGIPRVLNIYSYAPFFRAYFEALGVKKVIFSDFTSEELYRKGSKRGSIDPCFPSKVAIAHVHNLLFDKKGINLIFFPCIRTLDGEIAEAEGHWACPTVAATPEVVKASFTKERDEFKNKDVQYLDPVLDFEDKDLLKKQLYEAFNPLFGITKKENDLAVEEGYKALREYKRELRSKARETLDLLEKEKKVGVVLLGRPYHNDIGINHGILDEINKMGYPVFTIDSLPRDEDILERLFGDDIKNGIIKHYMDISDVWKKCYSENSSLKVWGAKYVAKHPNLAAIDLSSFRCGHDAPIYSTVEDILRETKTPYFTFHELDENKPTGSIKIRVETIDYFLKLYEREKLRKGGE